MRERFGRLLVDRAAAPYRSAGRFAWYFARGKLGGDPVFPALLARGLVPGQARILDLGCGQGLLASWLFAASALFAEGDWPTDWPAPPGSLRYRGVELMPGDIQRARQALGERADFTLGDIRSVDFGRCDVVVILDVLHYLNYAEQDDLLQRVRDALLPEGMLLLRVGDAADGIRFVLSRWVDRCVTFVRGHRLSSFHCRSLHDWMQALRQIGFSVESVPMSRGTPFANVLLIARTR